MGWVAILSPCRGSGKPILMVLRGACKERTQVSCRFVVAGSPAGLCSLLWRLCSGWKQQSRV